MEDLICAFISLRCILCRPSLVVNGVSVPKEKYTCWVWRGGAASGGAEAGKIGRGQTGGPRRLYEDFPKNGKPLNCF